MNPKKEDDIKIAPRLKKIGSKIETLSQEIKNTDLREDVDYNWEVDFILKNAQ